MSKVGIVNRDDESYKLLSQKLKVKSQKYNSKVKISKGVARINKV